MKNHLKTAVMLWVCLLLLIMTCHASNAIVSDPSLQFQGTYWTLASWGNGSTYYAWQSDVTYLNFSEAAGTCWTGDKVMQGTPPHGWMPRGAALAYEPTFHRGKVSNFTVNATLKIGNYQFLKENTYQGYAWFNVGVALWFQNDGADWNSTSSPAVVVGLKIFWMKYNGTEMRQNEPIYFWGDVGNDYHSLFLPEMEIQSGSWVTYTVNAKPYIETALNHWNVDYVTLKNVEFYIEGLGSEGEV